MNEPKKRGPKPKLKEGDLPGVDPIAQAYAVRVWNGQSPDLSVKERIARVLSALEAQGLLTTGISLPPIEEPA